MNDHSLIEVTHMLHKVSPSIIHIKCRLGEAMGKLIPINSSHEGGFGDLTQSSTHRIISHVPRG